MIVTDVDHLVQEPTFIKVPFCKKQFVIEFIRYAQPRELGKLSENIVGTIYEFLSPPNNECDFIYKGKRVEVKSSRAYSHLGKRSMCKIHDLSINTSYDCNIQHVKKNLFDWLFYIVYCDDGLQIFKVASKKITHKTFGYSDSQQRNHMGNGQFHLNSKTYNRHIKFMIQELTYEQIYDILEMSDGFI